MSQTIEPILGMAKFQSNKVVRAGQITEVVPAGCYVLEADGKSAVLRTFPRDMTVRYHPQVGDYWLVYEDGYQSLSPRDAFVNGYYRLD